MFRRELLSRHDLRYDEMYRSAQDYELWTRLLRVTRAANIGRPLLQYRIRGSSISRLRRTEQLANHDRIALLANRRLLPTSPLTAQAITNLRGRYGGHGVRDAAMNPGDTRWIDVLRGMLESFCRLPPRVAGNRRVG